MAKRKNRSIPSIRINIIVLKRTASYRRGFHRVFGNGDFPRFPEGRLQRWSDSFVDFDACWATQGVTFLSLPQDRKVDREGLERRMCMDIHRQCSCLAFTYLTLASKLWQAADVFHFLLACQESGKI